MELFLSHVAMADSLLALFYDQLSVEDRRHILYQSVATWSEEDSGNYEGLLYSPPPESDSLYADCGYDRLYNIAARTDRTPLFRAFQHCISGVEAISHDPHDYTSLEIPWRCNTPWGEILVGIIF